MLEQMESSSHLKTAVLEGLRVGISLEEQLTALQTACCGGSVGGAERGGYF